MASIFSQALSSKWAALVLLISTAGQLFCTTACQTSASRMLFAFSRDRAVPGHQLWSAINANKVPANAVMVTAGIATLLTLPALVEGGCQRRPGSGGLFAVVSIGVVGSVPVFRRSDLLPLESRRLVPGRLLEPARTLSLDGPVALAEILITSIVAMFPTSLGACHGIPAFEWKFVNYTPLVVFGVLFLLWLYWRSR